MTTRNLITTACIAVLSSIAFASTAQMPTTLPAPTASMDTRMAERDLDVLNAQIKTNADLDAYLAANTKTPFDALPQNERQIFLDSLMFSTKSLGSFNYAVLEDNLTPTEIYAILALFGHQQLTSRLGNAQVKTNLDRSVLQINAPKSKAITGDDFGAFGSTPSMGGTTPDGPGDGSGPNGNGNYVGYRCTSRANCTPANKNDICMHSC